MLCKCKGKCVRCCWLTSQSKLSINPAVRHSGRTAALLLKDRFMFSWSTWICHKCLLNTRVKASMVCWNGKDYPYMFNPASAASVAASVHPLLYAFVCVLFPLHFPRPYTSSFSRLFSSSGGAAKKPAAAEAPVNVKYNAPTSQIQPSIKKKSSTLQQLPSDKSKAFDFLNEEWV